MKILTPEKFYCQSCHKTFERKWTDKEAYKELFQNYPESATHSLVQVCDDCYESFNKWFEALPLETKIRMAKEADEDAQTLPN